MTAKELREAHKAKLAEADALFNKKDRTEEDKAKADAIIAESRSMKADIERLEYLEEAKAEQEAAEKRELARQTTGERRSKPEHQTEAKKPDVRVRSAYRAGKLKAFRSEEDAYASGQWLLATIGGDVRAQEWCSQNLPEYRVMSTTVNAAGGAVVPLPMEQAIIDLRESYGVARQELGVMPMTSDTLVVPRRTAGITTYFVSENGTITDSDMAFDNVQLTARKLASLTRISSELDEDSVISIADTLAAEIAWGFSKTEDECLFLGDGTSTYGGIVGLQNVLATASRYTAIAGNTAFSTLDLDDFTAMVARLPQYAVAGAKWYISRVGWANSMLRLAEAAGGNTVNNVAEGAPLQFLGFPVVISQVMNSTTTAQVSTNGLAYLANLRLGAVMGARRGIGIVSDSSRYFELDQIAIRATERFDLVVHDKGTSSVAGSIVMLSTPGA